jgi:hypothetical protein
MKRRTWHGRFVEKEVQVALHRQEQFNIIHPESGLKMIIRKDTYFALSLFVSFRDA